MIVKTKALGGWSNDSTSLFTVSHTHLAFNAVYTFETDRVQLTYKWLNKSSQYFRLSLSCMTGVIDHAFIPSRLDEQLVYICVLFLNFCISRTEVILRCLCITRLGTHTAKHLPFFGAQYFGSAAGSVFQSLVVALSCTPYVRMADRAVALK